MELFRNVKVKRKAIVFLGNSITEQGPWAELLPHYVVNRGIGSDNTYGVLSRLNDILRYKPKKIFLLIGINDIGRGHQITVIAENFRRIAEQVKIISPKTKLYVQSVLPLNERLLKFEYLKGKQDSIIALNFMIRKMSEEFRFGYIDLYPLFSNDTGELKEEYTLDGVHLRQIAYLHWIQFLKEKAYL